MTDLNDKDMKEKVNAWFGKSPYAVKLPSMPYPIRYELYLRYEVKQPLTQVEVQRSMPKEPEIEGEPTPLNEVKVGEKVKIKVLASGTVRESTYRGCKDCIHKIPEDEDECTNPNCNHLTGEIVDCNSKTYKVVDATGKDTGESVISVKVSPWQYDEFPDFTGKIITLQGRYEHKKGKSFESYDFTITRLLSVEDVWSPEEIAEKIKQGEPIPPEVEYGGQPMPKSEEPKEKPTMSGMQEFKSTIDFLRLGFRSRDNQPVEQLALGVILHKRYPELGDTDFKVLMGRLEQSGILERNDKDSTYILHLKKGE